MEEKEKQQQKGFEGGMGEEKQIGKKPGETGSERQENVPKTGGEQQRREGGEQQRRETGKTEENL